MLFFGLSLHQYVVYNRWNALEITIGLVYHLLGHILRRMNPKGHPQKSISPKWSIEGTKEGWPEEKHHCSKEIAEFWNHRCELSALDGLVFKGEKLVVPRVMRPEMLRRIHTGHLGIEKCKKRAGDVLFWRGMNAQIQELVSNCVICSESTAANQKELLINRRITSRPWEAVATLRR